MQFSKCQLILILLVVINVVSLLANQQIQVEVVCDKDIYYSGDIAPISASLKNNGEDVKADLFFAYVDPAGDIYSSWDKWRNQWESGKLFNSSVANIMLPKGVTVPLTPVLTFKFPTNLPKFCVFGDYTIYFLVTKPETFDVISNVASFTFNYPGVPVQGKWTNYPYGLFVGSIERDGDMMWCGMQSGVCSIDINTFEKAVYTTTEGPIRGTCPIAIDSDGKKWFRNDINILSVFDEESWTIYNKKTSDMPQDDAYALSADPNGGMWMSMENGVCLFKDDTWTYHPLYTFTHPGSIVDIEIDLDGNIWAVSSGYGAFLYDGKNWTNYTKSNSGLPEDILNAIAIDQIGNTWFGTDSKGVSVFDGSSWVTYNSSNSGLNGDGVTDIEVDLDNNKWFIVKNRIPIGVTKFDDTNWTFFSSSNSGLPDNDVRDIEIDTIGRIWFGTSSKGACIYDGENWIGIKTVDNSLPDGSIVKIKIDSKDRKWIGTSEDGVVSFDGEVWTNYNVANGNIGSDEINDIVIDSKDRIWVGMEEGGLSFFDGTQWKTYNASNSELLTNRITALAIDTEDRVWIGTFAYGLYSFDGENWGHYDTKNNELSKNYITSIAIYSKKQIWIGTKSGSIFINNQGTWAELNSSNSQLAPKAGEIVFIAVDLNDRKWISTFFSGVYVIDGENWSHYYEDNSAIYRPTCIAFEKGGKVWFNSIVFDGEKWNNYCTSNSNILSSAGAIAIDSKNRKWFGTLDGISVLDDSQQ